MKFPAQDEKVVKKVAKRPIAYDLVVKSVAKRPVAKWFPLLLPDCWSYLAQVRRYASLLPYDRFVRYLYYSKLGAVSLVQNCPS